jgi:hypothetical protein
VGRQPTGAPLLVPILMRLAVIRYDLEFLGLCPCMVDVEIIDAKQVRQQRRQWLASGGGLCVVPSGAMDRDQKRASQPGPLPSHLGATSGSPRGKWGEPGGPNNDPNRKPVESAGAGTVRRGGRAHAANGVRPDPARADGNHVGRGCRRVPCLSSPVPTTDDG